jgi:hypothetical protein
MKSGNRVKHTFRLPPDISKQHAEFAIRKPTTQASIVETAIASCLSPDGSERLGFQIEVANKALALLIRLWLTANPPPRRRKVKSATTDSKKL